MTEEKTIDGFDIPWRELSEEQLTQEITPARIRDFEVEVGESFVDQYDHLLNINAIVGFLMARHPERSLEMLEILNESKYASLNSIESLFVPEYSEEIHVSWLQDLCDFINLTSRTKRRMNTNLIIVAEHYS